MSILAIIPARMNSSRFPGKPLKKISGMPMIEHCYRRAKLVSEIDEVYVATCDKEINDYILSINGKSVLTSELHNRATSRTAEALEIIESTNKKKYDVVIMIQGDEPLISPESLRKLTDKSIYLSADIANIMCLIESDKVFEDKNNVKVVVDKNFNAMYFSREPIPCNWGLIQDIPRYMQTGIISFKRESLKKFNLSDETILEKAESVDMNRVIENGIKIRMIPSDQFSLGVDVEEELILAEQLMKKDHYFSKYLVE